MTNSHRIFGYPDFLRIEHDGQIFSEDELHEAIWLVNMEIRGAYLTKRERAEAKREIAQYETLLAALRGAGV